MRSHFPSIVPKAPVYHYKWLVVSVDEGTAEVLTTEQGPGIDKCEKLVPSQQTVSMAMGVKVRKYPSQKAGIWKLVSDWVYPRVRETADVQSEGSIRRLMKIRT